MGTPILGELLTILIQNKIFAYVVLISFLTIDSSLSIFAGDLFSGILGSAFTGVINFFGLPISVGSEHILIIAVITPLLIYSIKN